MKDVGSDHRETKMFPLCVFNSFPRGITKPPYRISSVPHEK